jgi:PKD repeat protein
VEAPLVANFTFDNVCFCTNTTFTDKTTGGQGSYTYDWDFDDGNSSNAQNPTHHYGKNGTYNVTLTVNDSDTPQNTDSQSYDVEVYALPSCGITALDEVCEYSEGNSASTTVGYSSYTWTLSDGTITAGHGTNSITWTAPSHTASPVNISVTVTDANDCTNTCYKDVTANEGPTANFSADPISCCAPLTVTFTDLSTAGDNTITGWDWDFGDGSSSTVQNPSHIYDAGIYDVTLNVTDEHGCTDTITKTSYISANEGPTANFSADPLSCCTPLTVTFTDESTAGDNPITGWSWDFDNDAMALQIQQLKTPRINTPRPEPTR